MSSTILVVDDKDMMRDSVTETLRRAGFGVVAANGGQAALDLIAKKRPDAIVTDLKMPGMTGVELLGKVREIDEELPVIVMTAFATVDTAVDAMRKGAFDYVTKPFEGDELIIAIKRGLKHAKLVRENAVLKASAGGGRAGGGGELRGLDRLIGESPAMRELKQQVAAVAGSQGTVLITGESGTGKEVVAQAIHDLSTRCESPFLAVNCAALSESLLESELFGHERGAFTGADKLRKGRFELADGGTLLLDEVSEVSPQIQAKLLRALQERAFERVGSSVTIGVDVRVLATSNRDLPAAAASGEFRSDLFFRLNVLPLRLPPLRERREDIALLAEHFVGSISRREGRQAIKLDAGAVELLSAYGWPGNVRELQNICERAVVLVGRGDVITRSLIEPWLGSPTASPAAQSVASPAANGEAGGDARSAYVGVRAVSLLSGGGNGQSNGIGHAVTPPPREAASLNGQQDVDRHAGVAVAEVAEPKPVPVQRNGQIRPLADIEREAIIGTLTHYNGHRQKTARALGIGVRTLGLKLKKWKEDQLVPQTL